MTLAEQARVGAARAAAQQAQGGPPPAAQPAVAPAGMPKTGGVTVLPLISAIAISLVTLAAGLVLRRRKAKA